ncbi:MAG: hypothetical protein OP8BY_1407 [Candidatus Saccharicenans subterraneus]|uniref:Uncharacterized protein n=1 Tax=Candidatus Saccharicenans subterraneus TaxID=2508984 RepID=A0A3E2BQ11_9BACT|nr:MAG: hypothetical protein OP8BY_1407 [Candidatus Saccharicenans subterraneum]
MFVFFIHDYFLLFATFLHSGNAEGIRVLFPPFSNYVWLFSSGADGKSSKLNINH